jgi:hypothetical protein
MPLEAGKSKAAFGHNVKAEVAAGKPQKQAVAIAFSEAGEKKKKKGGKKMFGSGSGTSSPNFTSHGGGAGGVNEDKHEGGLRHHNVHDAGEGGLKHEYASKAPRYSMKKAGAGSSDPEMDHHGKAGASPMGGGKTFAQHMKSVKGGQGARMPENSTDDDDGGY